MPMIKVLWRFVLPGVLLVLGNNQMNIVTFKISALIDIFAGKLDQ